MNVGSTSLHEVAVCSRLELMQHPHWAHAFATERKDRRYYELVEDTIHKDFDYRYFVIKDDTGTVRAVQPFFILDLDLLVGVSPKIGTLIDRVRRLFPGFMRLRTLMVGCVAGEGHLDATKTVSCHAPAQALASTVVEHARYLRAPLIVLKEFPAEYRLALGCFLTQGFTRVPSLPMTRLNIEYASFDDYMTRALNSATRTKLRRKFRAATRGPLIEMSIVEDITAIVDDIYPLYLNVYNRSKLHFEKLTKAYFCGLGRLMPDKVRFFVWRQNGAIVAFIACMLQGEALYAEYLGLDYTVALDLHLYHYAYRDMISWAIANGYKEFRSSGLNYDPKLHLRHLLGPIDLYVRHTSWLVNIALKWLLPWIEPTRHDKTLQKFANYHELWAP
jgi:Peptidogalycan biosysnthesis/recognition